MPSVGKVKAEDRISGVEDGQKNGGVGLGAGVWLHVGVRCSEERFEPVNSELLHLVHYFAAPVVALARVAFCIFVGQAATHSVEDGLAREIFGGDELNTSALAIQFFLDETEKYLVFVHSYLFLAETVQKYDTLFKAPYCHVPKTKSFRSFDPGFVTGLLQVADLC